MIKHEAINFIYISPLTGNQLTAFEYLIHTDSWT